MSSDRDAAERSTHAGSARARHRQRPRAIQRVALREPAAVSPPHPARTVPRGDIDSKQAADGADAIVRDMFAEPTKSRPSRLPALLPDRRLARAARPEREPRPPSLLQDDRFRIFWLTRLAVQIGQGAMVYAFLLIVADETDRATFNSLFVICSIVPSILFGLPAGIVGDALPRRPLMAALNLLRFAFAVALVLVEPSLLGIFAATIAIWTIFQFYAPTESAAMSELVPRHRLGAAQSLANLAETVAQIAGLVILAPLLLKTAGPQALFAVCGALFFAAFGLSLLMPRLDDHSSPGGRSVRTSLRGTLVDGWREIQADPVMLRALACDVLIGIGMSALIVIVPLYLKRVLDTPAENTVFVFAPAAVGLIVGLRFAPSIANRFGGLRVATIGLLGFALCVGSLGFVENLRTAITDGAHLPLNEAADLLRIPSLVLMAMLVSIPAGFFSASVSVVARSLLLGQSAPTRRGQTIATSTLLANLGALVPTFLAGVAADLFGVERVAVAIAVAIAAGATAAWVVVKPLPLPEGQGAGA